MRMWLTETKIAAAGIIIILGAAVLLSRTNTAPALTPAEATRAVVGGNSPNWRTIPFINVRTNQPMTLADFAGKTVVVQVVSIWCANCLEQQKQSAQALTTLGEAAPVYISLDMDIAHPDDDAKTVADFEDYKPFPWVFAISNKVFTRALINEFGYNVLNAPITPIFVIKPDGTASDLYIGNHNADDMVKLMQGGAKT